MMILEPKTHTGKKPIVYYSVYGWSKSDTYADFEDFYEYASEAIARAKSLVNGGFCVSAMVREELVYRRTKNGEISSSAPIMSI